MLPLALIELFLIYTLTAVGEIQADGYSSFISHCCIFCSSCLHILGDVPLSIHTPELANYAGWFVRIKIHSNPPTVQNGKGDTSDILEFSIWHTLSYV